MRLDIEKDINMLNNINVYSMEENVFSKFWEWVKKIWKKIIDFFKMLWQKIKNFFKGKRGEQVQKKAQVLNLKAQSVKTFDPEEFESPYDNMNQENPSNVSMSDDYKDYNDRRWISKFGKIIKTSMPVIKDQKVFENVKIPINYLLEEFYKKYYKEAITPQKALNFSWTDLLTSENPSISDQEIYKKHLGVEMGSNKGRELGRDQLFMILVYGEDSGYKKNAEYGPREITIWEFFNENDKLIKTFINFMSSNNLEKDMDKYDTSYLEKEIKNLEKAYKITLDDINRVIEKNPTYTTQGTEVQRNNVDYIKKSISRRLKTISEYMTHYQDVLLRKCQIVYLFEEIINKIA